MFLKIRKAFLFLLITFITFSFSNVFAASSDINNATVINPNSVTDGTFNERSSQFYMFELNSQANVSIEFSHSYIDYNYSIGRVYFYNSNNSIIYDMGFVGNNTGNYVMSPVGLPAGTYYIKIDSSTKESYSYSLKVNTNYSSNWEKEFNETPLEANSISVNTNYYGSCVTSSDRDNFEFTLNNPGYISFDFQHSYVDYSYSIVSVSLYNSDNSELCSYRIDGNNTGTLESTPIGVPAGTYYFKVNSSTSYQFTYEFKVNYTSTNNWEKEFNDLPQTSNIISLENVIYGSYISPSQKDYFSFSLNNTSDLTLSISHSYVDYSYTILSVSILDSSNQSVISKNLVGNNIGTEVFEITDLPSGDYYVLINSYSSTPYTYGFRLSTTGNDNVIPSYKDNIELDKPQTPSDPVKPDNTVNVTGIKLNKNSLNLTVGNSLTLTYTITPTNASNKDVIWTTSNYNIVSVSATGSIKALEPGEATITVTTEDGYYSDSCLVKVTQKVEDSKEEDKTPTQTTISVYRMYNKVSGEHLYTTDSNEVNVLSRTADWNSEGIAWKAATSGTGVYRLYSPITGNHLYTLDTNEIKVLSTQAGWSIDNNNRSLFNSSGNVPIYRLYNETIKQHLLTTDYNEYTVLVNHGWKQEGVALYALSLR